MMGAHGGNGERGGGWRRVKVGGRWKRENNVSDKVFVQKNAF